MTGPYDDIIGLPHHTSETHPRMSAAARAAQFAPFAALTGYDAAIRETARWVDEMPLLGEDARAMLDMKRRALEQAAGGRPEVTFTCFRQDARKRGGELVTVTGELKSVDTRRRLYVLCDGTEIEFDAVFEIESGVTGSLFGG